jgi:DNA-binding beta-propeller fold protein YncE
MVLRIGSPAALFATTMLTGAAVAGELKQVATIPIPGQPLTSFDVGQVDPVAGKYFLADRSNAGVDIFDTKTNTYVGRAGKFVGMVMKGAKVDNDHSGPDGVQKIGSELWAGDGNSTVQILDLDSLKTVAAISSGGKARLDEIAVDPKDHVFIGVNNADEPPFVTLISTTGEHKILGKVVFEDATDGAEQPAYNPADGMFYQSIPELKKDPKHGAVAVIDPRTAKLVKMLPLDNCHPTGLAFGPNGNFVVGCNANGKEDMPPVTAIMNAATGTVVAMVEGIGGADMVNYNAHNNQYYTASRLQPGGPVLGVIDATTNKLVQKIAIKGGYPHSVASDEASGQVYLPVGTVDGGDGTIHVYAPAS